MRRSDTIKGGATDKVCYLQALVDAGDLSAIKPYLETRERLKRKKANENDGL